ncbi:hypothetical protein ACFE04_010762 [Oxalis oulophora]
MDWFSWLSKASLDSSLTYEYALLFSRNELQEDDISYFNHEFLQSMGISVAKHRLEILKLARKEVCANSNGLAKLVSALNKTKKVFTKYLSKKGSSHEVAIIRSQTEAVGRKSEDWGRPVILPKIRTRAIAKSGPLDGRLMIQDKMMISNNKLSLKLSGPLDRKVNDRLVFAYKSPKLSRPLDGRVHDPPNKSPISKTTNFVSPKVYRDYRKEKVGDFYDDQSLWSTLFQDLKPT